ncbi:hypothetical protein E2C01_003212 [Portunus trituberculatus]|uniref:Uncharacterized protein n=1 Tax=Portunus trituberculatus TaxID=210409 RepID=A0A5B7CN42_PORTR|nr:hypothetical protein [Portunus trituberculatus]
MTRSKWFAEYCKTKNSSVQISTYAIDIEPYLFTLTSTSTNTAYLFTSLLYFIVAIISFDFVKNKSRWKILAGARKWNGPRLGLTLQRLRRKDRYFSLLR